MEPMAAERPKATTPVAVPSKAPATAPVSGWAECFWASREKTEKNKRKRENNQKQTCFVGDLNQTN